MNVLLIGSGGREHALAWKLRQSPRLGRLLALPGSDALASCAEIMPGDPLRFADLTTLCREQAIDLVVVGPEAPLAAGLADALAAAGIAVFGPLRFAARLESSKSFAKAFMERHDIPTARYETFSDAKAARAALARFGLPVVVKADGLAAGKGVRVCATTEEAESVLEDFLEHGTLGDSGRRVVLEEMLTGPETTIMGFCDGRRFLPLPPSSDHKRLLDGDQGPNTGGMGVFAPTPEVDGKIMELIRRGILDRVTAGLQAEGLTYCGILYCGLMLTAQGPKVLEFNVRFGDPETQAVLPLLQNDLLEIIEATVRGKLSGKELSWSKSSVCVVLASEGYPDKPATGRPILGLESPHQETLVFHAGTRREGESWKTTGGRVLGITAVADTLAQARSKAYASVGNIHFDGMHYRKDIGQHAVEVPPITHFTPFHHQKT